MVDASVVSEMTRFLGEVYGNPSSLHDFGQTSQNEISRARHEIALRLGCQSDEIIFTSSGSEGNNLCIKGFAFANKHKGNHIITTKIEHPSILETCMYLSKSGFEVTYLDVDSEGFVSTEALSDAIRKDTILVSIGHVNSEIGTVQDLKALLLGRNNNVAFHSDCVQSFLKTDFNVNDYDVDMASFSGHKFHAPKGIGFVYKKRSIKLEAQIHGGMQEAGVRSGTENVPYIVALAQAIKLYTDEDVLKMKSLQEYLISSLEELNGVIINGPRDLQKRVCTNINIANQSFEGEFILRQLSKKGVFVSTGSACSSKHTKISPVLQAIKCNARFIQGNVRIGISKYTSKDCIDTFLDELKLLFNGEKGLRPL